MHSSSILISTFFFIASAVLADRSLEHRSPQLNMAEKRANATFDSTGVKYANWAGATLSQSAPSFYVISGTFEVPDISGPTDSAVGIWVGIDGSDLGTPCRNFFQAGVGFMMTPNGSFYGAIAEWSPPPGNRFTDIEVSPGDNITVTVSVAPDLTSGYATIVNIKHGTGQKTIQTLPFRDQQALCQLSAEWIVSKVGAFELANFGVVSFTKTVALGQDNQKFTPAESVITEIAENGRPMTSATFADENEVRIRYVGT